LVHITVEKELQEKLIALALRLANSQEYFESIKIKRKFSLENPVEKTIKTRLKVGNPHFYDPTQASPNPKFFDVLAFTGNTFMLSYSIGDGECLHTYFYYHNGSELCHPSALFNGASDR